MLCLQFELSNEHKLVIKCEEENEAHPHCPHGPTLLFYYQDKGIKHGYFACSAHRDKKTCSFHLPVAELTEKHLRKRYEAPTAEYRDLRKRFGHSDGNEQQRHFCHSCNLPLLQPQLTQHKGHSLVRNLSKQFLQDPTLFLRPLENDKVQAQYFFDNKALQFFQKCFHDLQINKVLCIGAPRLHAYLRNTCSSNIQSFLLDFDQRFSYFFKDNHFAWFNMCNNYFFDNKQKQKFKNFLLCDDTERLLIFADPPFGCRTEPISNTIHQITRLYNKTNHLPHQPLPTFWIFPYFSAHYIQQVMPQLQMCDYKVNYTNHLSYSDGAGARKLGSPVRIFTNVPLERLLLPVTEEYKYCRQCQKYTALENRHCAKCNECPARNGSTYRHCDLCGICVKPYYVHCRNCRRCTQAGAHNCQEYQARQRCWICLQVGHTEHHCSLWQKRSGTQGRSGKDGPQQGAAVIRCLLCGAKGHNERRCQQRYKVLEETTFLSETYLKFKV